MTTEEVGLGTVNYKLALIFVNYKLALIFGTLKPGREGDDRE